MPTLFFFFSSLFFFFFLFFAFPSLFFFFFFWLRYCFFMDRVINNSLKKTPTQFAKKAHTFFDMGFDKWFVGTLLMRSGSRCAISFCMQVFQLTSVTLYCASELTVFGIGVAFALQHTFWLSSDGLNAFLAFTSLRSFGVLALSRFSDGFTIGFFIFKIGISSNHLAPLLVFWL